MLTKERCGLSVILSWLLTVIVIIGNGLVIYLITTRRKLRTKTNWFVLSLAVADFGVGAIYFPSTFTCRIRDMCVSRHVRVIVFHNIRISDEHLRSRTGPLPRHR